APLCLWNVAKGSWHFITVPDEQSLEIRAECFVSRGGFGSVKVEACVGDFTWRTSVFPQKDGTYLLPVKAEVRRRTGIAAGDEVSVQLEIL
ncbi:MAG: DUF1905 domain-containing protein, partial [Sphingomicrobium sp.]